MVHENDPYYEREEIDELMQELNKRGLLDGRDHEDPQYTQPQAKRREGSRAVQFRKGIGKFLFPTENTWAAHRDLIKEPALALNYNTANYPRFDNIFHQNVNYKPIWDYSQGRFKSYDVLRENMAIVRNYIMTEYFADGSVDANDAQKVKNMAQIAKHIADGMNNDKWLFNPFKHTIKIEKANLPGTGAQYIYNQILKHQNYHSWLAPIMWPLSFIFSSLHRDWDLPALADSPFSDAALRRPPPTHGEQDMSDEDIMAIAEMMDKDSIVPQDISEQYAQGIDGIAEDFTHASAMYTTVEELQEPTRRESIELAKEILRKLKVKFGEAFIENGLTASAANNFSILDSLKGAVRVYEFHLHKVMQLDAAIMDNPAVLAANKAIGKLGYIAKLEVLRVASKNGDKKMASTVEKQLMDMPKSWQPGANETFASILDDLDSGLSTVLTRINQVSDRDTSAGNWLGFSNENTLGDHDPSLQKSGKKSEKAMSDDAYFRQLQTQRAARAQQMSVIHSRNQQRARQLDDDEHGHTGANGAARKPASQTDNRKDTSMSSLIAKDQVDTMRSSLKTDPNAQAVQTSRRQDVLRREQERKNRDKTSKMKTIEQVNRANKRTDQQQSHEPEGSIAAPMGKKRDHSHGI